MCEHHAPRYRKGWSPAWGRKPGDPALELRVTWEGYTPPPVGQVAEEGEKAGHRAFLVAPPQTERGPPDEGNWPRPLAPWRLSRLPSIPLPLASNYTLGTSGAASRDLMETLSAAALHVRGGQGRSRARYCPRVVAGGVCPASRLYAFQYW